MAPYFCGEDERAIYSGGVENVVPLARMDEKSRKELWATLAMRHCPGLGVRNRARLVKHFGTAYDAIQNSPDWRGLGLPARLDDAIKSGNWRKAAKKEWDCAHKLDASILLWGNSIYPGKLRELPDAPLLLYCAGDINLLRGPAIGIVGSRNSSAESCRIADYLGRSLSACGITVASGMALGIDYTAHQSALADIGKSIGILGTGIDLEYPSSNKSLYAKMRRQGLLLSEFAPGTPPAVYNFPIRNRIISGISLGIIVVEAAQRSGSLITARLALEQNREVFAVPGAPLSERSIGCQNLIRQGAHPVFCLDDVLQVLEHELKIQSINIPRKAEMITSAQSLEGTGFIPRQKETSPKFVSPVNVAPDIAEKIAPMDDSEKICAILAERGPMQADDLASALSLESGAVNALLTGMEILGKITRLPGARYTMKA